MHAIFSPAKVVSIAAAYLFFVALFTFGSLVSVPPLDLPSLLWLLVPAFCGVGLFFGMRGFLGTAVFLLAALSLVRLGFIFSGTPKGPPYWLGAAPYLLVQLALGALLLRRSTRAYYRSRSDARHAPPA